MMKQAIEDGYLGRAMGSENFDDDVLDDVFEELTFGTSKYNGNTVFNPAPGKDVDDLEDWLEHISKPKNKFIDKHFGLPDGYKSFDQFKKDLGYNVDTMWGEPKFTLESVGRGKYMLKSKTGKVVMKGGKPYILDWYVNNPSNPKGARIPWDDPSIFQDDTIGEKINSFLGDLF